MEKGYSSKLRYVSNLILEILKEHDVAACVVLHEPGFSEFINFIEPSYSCAKIEGDQLKIRSKASDYNGDTQKRDKALTDTSNMLVLLAETTGTTSLMLYHASDVLDYTTGAVHTKSKFTKR